MAAISEDNTVTLTVRFIRSFEYRNFRAVVFSKINLNQTTKEFKDFVARAEYLKLGQKPTQSRLFSWQRMTDTNGLRKQNEIKTRAGIPPPFKTFCFDTLKIQHKAHQSKTNDPIIRTDDDETLILKEDLTLKENGVEHETELSFFKEEDYLKYKANPVLLW